MELSKGRKLNPTKETREGLLIRKDLEHALIGQPDAIEYYVGLIEKFRSRLYDETKPIGAVLATGPTGSGKTFSAEMFAESLQPRIVRDWKKNLLRIDCGEFQHSHEIAKLIGSPPGYLGHRETKPVLSPDRIGLLQRGSEEYPFAIIVFDEIEKASDGLWNILLSVLDKGTITLGSNELVDLSKTVIIMTSNAGFSDQRNGLGFAPPSLLNNAECARIGADAAKRKFSAEFINRLDKVIPFNALTTGQVARILQLELGKLQLEVFTKCVSKTIFAVTPAGQTALLKEGYDTKYNARGIKRAIDRNLRVPLSRVLGGFQLESTEGVLVDFVDEAFDFRALPKNSTNFVLHGTESDKDAACTL